MFIQCLVAGDESEKGVEERKNRQDVVQWKRDFSGAKTAGGEQKIDEENSIKDTGEGESKLLVVRADVTLPGAIGNPRSQTGCKADGGPAPAHKVERPADGCDERDVEKKSEGLIGAGVENEW